MKKAIAASAAVVVVAAVSAGCGSDSSTAGHPTTQSTSASTKRGAITKTVGEEAGYACTADRDPSAKCAVKFTVTELTPIDCSVNNDIQSDQRVVRISLDAVVNSDIPGTSYPSLFLISDNWKARSSDGYITKVKPVWCGTDDPRGPLNDMMQVGDKARGTDNFAVPRNAEALVLRADSFPGWEWQIPAT